MHLIKEYLVILTMNRLKAIREERHLRQEDVAAALGVHFTTISKYEVGTSSLTDELICKFCDFYGVTSDYLLGRSNQPQPVVSESDTELLTAYHGAPADIKAIIDTALAPYKKETDARSEASAS